MVKASSTLVVAAVLLGAAFTMAAPKHPKGSRHHPIDSLQTSGQNDEAAEYKQQQQGSYPRDLMNFEARDKKSRRKKQLQNPNTGTSTGTVTDTGNDGSTTSRRALDDLYDLDAREPGLIGGAFKLGKLGFKLGKSLFKHGDVSSAFSQNRRELDGMDEVMELVARAHGAHVAEHVGSLIAHAYNGYNAANGYNALGYRRDFEDLAARGKGNKRRRKQTVDSEENTAGRRGLEFSERDWELEDLD